MRVPNLDLLHRLRRPTKNREPGDPPRPVRTADAKGEQKTYYCDSVEEFALLQEEYGIAARWMIPTWSPAEIDPSRQAHRVAKVKRRREEVLERHRMYGSRWFCHLLGDDGPLWVGEGAMKGNDVY